MSDYRSSKPYREQAADMLAKCTVDAGTSAAALLAVADAIAGLTEILRPVAEPLTSASKPAPTCPVTAPKQCVRARGHGGWHVSNSGTTWPAGDTEEAERAHRCPEHSPRGYRCVQWRGHDGTHSDGVDERDQFTETYADKVATLRAKALEFCNTAGPVTDRGAFGVLRRKCSRNAGHDGKHADGLGTEW